MKYRTNHQKQWAKGKHRKLSPAQEAKDEAFMDAEDAVFLVTEETECLVDILKTRATYLERALSRAKRLTTRQLRELARSAGETSDLLQDVMSTLNRD